MLPSTPGQIVIDVKKDGFFPIHTPIAVTAAQQAELENELQPAKAEEEEVTVYATRRDARLQDSPTCDIGVGKDGN